MTVLFKTARVASPCDGTQRVPLLQAYGAAGAAAHTNAASSVLPTNGTALGLLVSGTSQSPFVYDPLAQINIEDLNKAFLERQRASLLGSMYNLR